VEDIVLINITGRDRPGLNACFAGILARYDVRVLDIGQSVMPAGFFRRIQGHAV
jgi:phosphoserine phosphatase